MINKKHPRNVQTLPPKMYAPPPSPLSSACLLIGSRANGVPTGYEKKRAVHPYAGLDAHVFVHIAL